MAESSNPTFSKTAYDRLPSSVRKLGKDAQTVCIHLRLRKSADTIAKETGIGPDATALLVSEVTRALIASGNYDMIADPVFVPIDEEEGESLRSSGPDMEDKILAGRFMSSLKKALASIPVFERRLLHLFFEARLSAKEIRAFLKASGGGRAPEKDADVFSQIDKALKMLLDSLSNETNIGRGTLTIKGLKEVLSQTGVETGLMA
jgi:hypothetical protein